jgi:hypothetical protein
MQPWLQGRVSEDVFIDSIKILSVESRFRNAVALDETVVELHGLRAHVGLLRNMVIALKSLRTDLDKLFNKPILSTFT